jgi:hypothetical protein
MSTYDPDFEESLWRFQMGHIATIRKAVSDRLGNDMAHIIVLALYCDIDGAIDVIRKSYYADRFMADFMECMRLAAKRLKRRRRRLACYQRKKCTDRIQDVAETWEDILDARWYATFKRRWNDHA